MRKRRIGLQAAGLLTALMLLSACSQQNNNETSASDTNISESSTASGEESSSDTDGLTVKVVNGSFTGTVEDNGIYTQETVFNVNKRLFV